MSIFHKYAPYYDDIYQDKNYKKECAFLEKLFNVYSRRRVRTILDLGCGTCSHGISLAKKGYRVTGVDLSSTMLAIASAKIREADTAIRLVRGNVQSSRLNRKFDAVISMFNVMGYQITDEAFRKAAVTARTHLKKGGLFIFDVWYGPAVLNDRPRSKTKAILTAAGERIVRCSKCRADVTRRTVEICFVTKKYEKRRWRKLAEECHKVRFFFLDEIEYFLNKTGFRVRRICPFLRSGRCLTIKDWNMTVVGEAV